MKQLGNWYPLMKPFVDSGEFIKIRDFLRNSAKEGKKIVPDGAELFKSFELVDRFKVKSIIVLMEPYNDVNDDKVILADGVPLSCKNRERIHPVLEKFYISIERAYGEFNPDMDYRYDNSYLLKEQGVMLLNASLTTEVGKVGVHRGIWKPFMKFFFEEVINKYFTGVPIVLCGRIAEELSLFINKEANPVLSIEHPMSAVIEGRDWQNKDCFNWINNHTVATNRVLYKVNWRKWIGEDLPGYIPF